MYVCVCMYIKGVTFGVAATERGRCRLCERVYVNDRALRFKQKESG